MSVPSPTTPPRLHPGHEGPQHHHLEQHHPGAQNFAVLGSANLGDTPNLVIRGNWLDGGHCTVKRQSLKSYRLKVQLAHNRFGPNRKVSYCPVQAEPQITLSAWNNVYEGTLPAES